MRYYHDTMLPERAFQSVGGKMTLEGGGNQPAPAQPTTATQYNTNIPEYAKPYVTNMLGATQQQLFNVDSSGGISGFKPYQPYSTNMNDYFAGFSPMQQQAQQSTANMQVPGQYGQASGLAGAAGMGSFGAGQQYNRMATDPNSMQAFMSPYQQNVTDFQKQQAVMDYNRGAPAAGSAASKAGAFGGSRQAIVESEANRSLQNQLAGIQATGTQDAFKNAQQAQQFGANLGMQGYGQALQGASTLANIGGQELGAQQSIANAQNTMGAQQQAMEQNKINQGIQNYATQQQYPMMQLGMMSNMLRGLPMQSTTTQSYQASPSTASQVVGSAGALASAYKGLTSKEGGVIKGLAHGGSVKQYAVGGEVKQQLSMMSDEQLKQVLTTSASNEIRAMAGQILAEHQMAKQMTANPNAEQGLMAANTGNTFENMAGGGIIACGEGDLVGDVPKLTDEEMAKRLAEPVAPGLPVTPMQKPADVGSQDLNTVARGLQQSREEAGVVGKPRAAERAAIETQLAGLDSKESSENWFKAAVFFANLANTPGGLLRSATESGAKILPEFAKLQADQTKIRNNYANIQANIDEADRLERMGLVKDAESIREKSAKEKGENDRANAANERARQVAEITANASVKGHEISAKALIEAERMRGGRPDATKQEQFVLSNYAKVVATEHPDWPTEKVQTEAYARYQKDKGYAYGKSEATAETAADKRYTDSLSGKAGAGLRAAKRKLSQLEETPEKEREKDHAAQVAELRTRIQTINTALRAAADRPEKPAGGSDTPARSNPTLERNADGSFNYVPASVGG